MDITMREVFIIFSMSLFIALSQMVNHFKTKNLKQLVLSQDKALHDGVELLNRMTEMLKEQSNYISSLDETIFLRSVISKFMEDKNATTIDTDCKLGRVYAKTNTEREGNSVTNPTEI